MRKLIAALPVAMLLVCGAAQVRADTCNGFANNLVSNCGFESGDLTSWTASLNDPNLFGVDSIDQSSAFPTPYNGTYEAYLSSPPQTSASLTQNLSTIAGTLYLIQFALLSDLTPASPYGNSFSLLFGGNTIATLSAIPNGAYRLYSYTGTASSSSTALSFLERNDEGYFELDSVSVTPMATTVTPEPSSWMLLGTGMVSMTGMALRSAGLRRRRHAPADASC